MKKILCYFGVIVLFTLAILPPVLRVALPDKLIEKGDEVEEKSFLLACSSSSFATNTRYENKKITMIVLKKIIEKQEDLDIDEIEEDETSDLAILFNALKGMSSVTYNALDDGEAIAIDFALSEHTNLGIEKITQEIEKQKAYYESQGLVCNIR